MPEKCGWEVLLHRVQKVWVGGPLVESPETRKNCGAKNSLSVGSSNSFDVSVVSSQVEEHKNSR